MAFVKLSRLHRIDYIFQIQSIRIIWKIKSKKSNRNAQNRQIIFSLHSHCSNIIRHLHLISSQFERFFIVFLEYCFGNTGFWTLISNLSSDFTIIYVCQPNLCENKERVNLLTVCNNDYVKQTLWNNYI